MKTQVSKKIFSLVLIASLALAVTAVNNNKKGTIQYDATNNTQQRNLIQTGTRYCKGDALGNSAQCTQFFNDCSVCWEQEFIFQCLWMCDSTGTCGGNTCPVTENPLCSMNMELCNTCFQTWSECSCPKGTYMIINPDYSQSCEILPCPWGFYQPDPNCSDCTECDVACNGCFGLTNNDCYWCSEGFCDYQGLCVRPDEFMCPEGTFMQMDPWGCFDCVPGCPPYFFGNPVTGKCEQCPLGCPWCTSFDSCQQPCDSDFCFFNDQCQPLDFQCPAGQYKVQTDPSLCFECMNECVQCPDGSWCDDQNHLCNPYCPDGYIVDKQCLYECPPTADGLPQYFTAVPYSWPEVYQCVPCALCPSNAYCDPIKNFCTPCDFPSFIFQGYCIDTCPEGFFLLFDSNGAPYCYSDCPSGLYGDVESRSCQPCNYPCANCVDSATKCSFPCPKDYFFYNFDCIPQCPYGTYPFGHTDPNQAICLEGESCFCGNCHPSCATCNGGLSTNCVSCPPGYWLTTDGKCVDTCPYGTYPREDNFFCQCCHSLCSSCYGPQVNQCYGCVGGALFDDNSNTCYEEWDVQGYTSNQVVEQQVNP